MNQAIRANVLRRSGVFFQACGMAVLAVAGASKLLDLPAFSAALLTWGLFSKGVIVVLTIAVPSIEICIVAAWLARVRPFTLVVVAMVVVAGFSMAYSWAWLEGFRPDCGCLGKMLAMESAKHQVWPAVIRNMILECVFAIGLWLDRPANIAAGVCGSPERAE